MSANCQEYDPPSVPHIPRVELIDENGRRVYSGYYFAYPEYQGFPLVSAGVKPKPIPLVEGIVTYDPGDWGLANTPRFLKVTTPHRMVVIDDQLGAILERIRKCRKRMIPHKDDREILDYIEHGTTRGGRT